MISISCFSDLIRNSTPSEQFVGFAFNQGHHYGAHTHGVEDANSTDDENERCEDEWVEHHSPDIVVGKVSQQHVHEHWSASTSHIVLEIKNKLETIS